MLEQGISLSGESKDYFIDGRIEHLRARIAANGGSPVTSVLDFACGVGDASSRLAAAFDEARVLGVDIAAGAVEEARRAHRPISSSFRTPCGSCAASSHRFAVFRPARSTWSSAGVRK